MKKIENEIKFDNYKKRKILRIFIMIFSLLTIVLAILSLIIKIPAIFSLIALVVATILNRIRDRIKI